MSRFYAAIWQDGSFDATASVLAFDSKAARSAFSAKAHMRFEPIDSKKKATLERQGRIVRLALWDASEPHGFNIVQ